MMATRKIRKQREFRKAKAARSRRTLPIPRRRPIPYLAALVRFEQGSARIRAWVSANRAPRRNTLHDVAITQETWTEFPPGAGEILVSFYDRKGNHLESRAWWARADYFGDRSVGRRGRITGGQRPPRIDERVLYAAVPERAVYLSFHRIEVVRRSARKSRRKAGAVEGEGPWGPVALKTNLLSVYILPDVDPVPEIHPELFPLPFLEWFLEWFREWLRSIGCSIFGPPGWPEDTIERKGWVDSVETIHAAGSTEGKFHIVILGEGYAEGELSNFDDAAKRLADRMLETEPFKSVIDMLEISSVRCISYDSGVTRCPKDAGSECSDDYEELETYFEVEGCWVNETDPSCLPSSPTYLGTPHPEYVYEAAEEIAPYEEVGLYIVLANVDVYGGSAFRSQKLAFVPAYSNEVLFYGLGLHESAHVLGDLVEEYISPLPWDGSTPRNAVHEDAKEGAWWKELASAAELKGATDEFRHVYTCPDDPADGDCQLDYNSGTLSDAEDPDVLGLFWGAQFIDPEDDPCGLDLDYWDGWTNPLGNHFYRAMARCKMRNVTWEFCRACAAEIDSAVRGGLV